jgi:Icc-related predicted phosphoesterase
MRVAWLTDIHLNFLGPVQLDRFFSTIRASRPDVTVISGDIGEAPRLGWYLKRIEANLLCPVYFVLGNHDFYMSSFDEVRASVSDLVRQSRWLTWLTEAGLVDLAPGVGLIGHEGWADGRLGDYERSELMLNDYVRIRDLTHLTKQERLQKLNQLGDETAAYIHEWLPRALARYRQIVLVTHVPPFQDACWHEGEISDDDYLPHFGCKAAGDALVEIMRMRSDSQLTVLCGHTHGGGQVQILDNLRVLTGAAEYGKPAVQQIFEF